MKKLLAISLIVLALVLIGCKNKSITGGAVAVDKIDPAADQSTGTCKDSDQGIDTDIKCVVTVGDAKYYDTCLGGLLVEYYCDGDNQANQNIRCENECDGGKCI